MLIVLPVDGSSYTLKAAQVLVHHARLYSEPPSVVLFTVALPIGTPLARAQISKATLDDYYREVSAQALAPAEAVLKDAGLAYEARDGVGDPAEQIAAEARRLQPDLLIMGTHGHSALKGFVMGSVASKVVASTTVPVLLVR
ncbi:universal stress protein [Thiomonas intermedia]|uniref:universal stress protein n=1 Tax=Thiomonas intermedia TaxID=926 RepID=UPI0009A48D9E|nr:universal stress protein [Thiomonas intermedia]